MAVPAHIVRGRGDETVVFLHGVGGSKECWQPQLEACASRYRAVAWDMPGYGETPPLPSATTPLSSRPFSPSTPPGSASSSRPGIASAAWI